MSNRPDWASWILKKNAEAKEEELKKAEAYDGEDPAQIRFKQKYPNAVVPHSFVPAAPAVKDPNATCVVAGCKNKPYDEVVFGGNRGHICKDHAHEAIAAVHGFEGNDDDQGDDDQGDDDMGKGEYRAGARKPWWYPNKNELDPAHTQIVGAESPLPFHQRKPHYINPDTVKPHDIKHDTEESYDDVKSKYIKLPPKIGPLDKSNGAPKDCSGIFHMKNIDDILKMPHADAKEFAYALIDASSAREYNKLAAKTMVFRSRNSKHLAEGAVNFLLAHPGDELGPRQTLAMRRGKFGKSRLEEVKELLKKAIDFINLN